MANIKEVSKDFKEAFDTYTFTALPAEADVEGFDKWARAWTMLGSGEISAEELEYMVAKAEEFKKAGIKFRFGANERDTLSNAIYTSLDGLKEAYKPFKGYAGDLGEDTIELIKPTYDAHAIAADCYNEYCKIGQVRAKSTVKHDAEKIMNDETLTDNEKAIKVTEMRIAAKKAAGKTGEFSGLQPVFRGFNAKDVHLILGKDCKTPVKVIVIRTVDGFDNMDDIIKAEAKLGKNEKRSPSRFYGWVMILAKKYDIPIVNISTKEGREKLDKLVPLIIKQ